MVSQGSRCPSLLTEGSSLLERTRLHKGLPRYTRAVNGVHRISYQIRSFYKGFLSQLVLVVRMPFQ